MHGKPRINEKSKDFFGALKRIFKELNKYNILLISSLLFAALGSILSIVTPNRLSVLTDSITEGIGVNQENLKIILANEYKPKPDVLTIIEDETIPLDDRNEYSSMMSWCDCENDLNSIPKSIRKKLYPAYEIDGVTITTDDQIELHYLIKDINPEDQQSYIKALDNAPENIKKVVVNNLDFNKVIKAAIILGIIMLFSALLSYFTALITAIISNKSAQDLRNKISKKINKLPLRYFDNNQVGDVLSRVTNDVDTVAQGLNNSLATLVTSITLLLGSLFMMIITNYIMAFAAVISTVIGFVFMVLILSKSQKYFNLRQEELGKLNSHIEEVYSGILVVKAYNGKKISDKEFDKLNESVYKANKMSQFLSGLMHPLMGFIGNLGYVAVCIVGAILAFNGHISFGVIVAFMIYVRLFNNPLTQMAQTFTALQSSAAAGERVFEFLDEEEQTDESNIKTKIDVVKGNIEFKDVKFSYNEDKVIIKDFNVKVKHGQKIAIVGPTGAGKTTMVNLLMKFYEINDGDIIIDGKSIKDLTREQIHSLFTMVLQDTWLFNGTIKDNIKFNRKNVSDEDVMNAINTVGLKHFIETLPDGINTVITESDSISSGQKQLLTIARGMIEDAPFLILDEATSNVDTRTEELVQKAMDKLMKGRTSFIIAHRLSTIKNADIILVMNEGNIIEQGTHEELLKKKGFYANLYNSQFEL